MVVLSCRWEESDRIAASTSTCATYHGTKECTRKLCYYRMHPILNGEHVHLIPLQASLHDSGDGLQHGVCNPPLVTFSSLTPYEAIWTSMPIDMSLSKRLTSSPALWASWLSTVAGNWHWSPTSDVNEELLLTLLLP